MRGLDSIIAALRDITATLTDRIHKLEVQEQESVLFSDVSASADLTLTNVAQDIPGAELLLTPGTYLVIGTFLFRTGADILDNNFQAIGSLDSNDIQADEITFYLFYDAGTGLRLENTVSKIWHIDVFADEIIKLQARKSGGTGTSEVLAVNTTLITARLSIIG